MPIDPVALARALVLALFPAIAAAIKAGTTPQDAKDAAWIEHCAAWREAYGSDVAYAVACTLDDLMAWHVMSPIGRLEWYSQAPVADLRPPPEAIPTPPDAMERVRQGWRALWGETG